MANSISNIDLSFVGSQALVNSQAKTLPFDVFTTGYYEGKIEGDVVKVDVMGDAQATAAWNDTTNNHTTDRSISEAFVDVTLNQRRATGFTISADDYIRIGNAGLTARLQRSVRELVRDANVVVMNQITNANFGAAVHTGVASTLDVDAIGVINTNADINKWTVSDKRKMILTPAYYWNVATEAQIVNVDQRGSAEVNQGGMISNSVLGWDLYDLATIPSNSENLVGFCTDGRGLAVAFGVKADWDSKNTYYSEIFTDPVTGFTYKLTVNEVSTTHDKSFVVESLFGVGKGVGDALKRIVSA